MYLPIWEEYTIRITELSHGAEFHELKRSAMQTRALLGKQNRPPQAQAHGYRDRQQ